MLYFYDTVRRSMRTFMPITGNPTARTWEACI